MGATFGNTMTRRQEGEERRRYTSSSELDLENQRTVRVGLHRTHPLLGEAARIIALPGKHLKVKALGPRRIRGATKAGRGSSPSLRTRSHRKMISLGFPFAKSRSGYPREGDQKTKTTNKQQNPHRNKTHSRANSLILTRGAFIFLRYCSADKTKRKTHYGTNC